MGYGAEKKAGSGEVRCVVGTAPALLQSGKTLHKPTEFRKSQL